MFETRGERLVEKLRAWVLPVVEQVMGHVPASPNRDTPTAPPPPDQTTAEIDKFTREVAIAPTWQARFIAAQALAELRGDRVVDALVRAVRDPSAEVAVAAVEALACQPDARAAEDLREVIRTTEGFVGPFTRAAAVEAVARVQGRVAIPLLIDTLHDGDAEVSMAAIVALSKLAPRESSARLHALLEDHSGYYLPVVRIATAKALEQSGHLDPARARALLDTETVEGVRVVLERASARGG